MAPKRRASPKGRPSRGKFKCLRCDRLVNGDERNNHVNKIHDGDKSVQFEIFCGDEKQTKLNFFKSVSNVPPSEDSAAADSNGNLVHEESVPPPPAPVSQVQGEAASPPPPSPMDLQSPSSPSPTDLQRPSSTVTVPASNLRRVTAAADADYHTLNETIKLSSRGYNHDVMLVCSDGCIDSSRVVLGAIFPFLQKLFDIQSYEEDSIISMPDYSAFEINTLLFEIERENEVINVSGTVLSLLSVECQKSATLVEVRMDIEDFENDDESVVGAGPGHVGKDVGSTSLEVPDHEEVKSSVPEEVVGAGPGHVGKRPQDVGSTSLEVPDHEEVKSNVPEEVVGAGPGHVGKLPQDVGSTHLAPLSHEAPFQPVFREEVQKFLDLKVEVNPDFNSKIIRHGVISKIRDDFDVQIQLPRKGAENAIIMITGYEKNATEARDAILKIVGQFESMVHEEASSDTQVHSMIEQMNDCNGVR